MRSGDSGSEPVQICDDLCRVICGIADLVGLEHTAIFTDQHRNARRFLLYGALGRTVQHSDRTVGIAQKCQFESNFPSPVTQRLAVTERDAQDGDISLGKVRGSVTEP